MRTPNTGAASSGKSAVASSSGKIRTPIFLGLIVVSVCTILVVLYGFRLANHAQQVRTPVRRPRNLHPHSDNKHSSGKTDSDHHDNDDDLASSDELIEISSEDLKEFEVAINSMKSTLRDIRAPMANKRVDPLLAAHPNHRLIYHDLHKADREHSLFLSLTSYYDTSCKETIRSIFDNAKDDEDRMRIFVGAVQVSTPVPPHTTTLEPPKGSTPPPLAVEPLPEHSFDSCLGDAHLTDCPEAPFCPADNVKLRNLPKEKWLGHAHARYLSLSMYRSESYVLLLDRRATRITFDWHNLLEQEWVATSIAAGTKRVVLTGQLPVVEPAGVHEVNDHHNDNHSHHEHHRDTVFHRVAVCTSSAQSGSQLPPIIAGSFKPSSDEAFVKTSLVSGSFVFGTGKILLETLTDNTAWMTTTARDWQLSTALYNAGYQSFVSRKMVFATEKGIKSNANETALEVLHASEVEEAEKQALAFVEGRKKLTPVKAGGGGGVFSGNIMLDDQEVVIPHSEFHKDPSEFAKVAQKAMKGIDLCKEQSS